jgi:hypothetical protein
MRSFLILSFLLVFNLLNAQYVSIPDAAFRSRLKLYYPSCFNSQDMLDTTCSSIVTTKILDLSGLGISSLQGIEYFDALTKLTASNNSISRLPRIPRGLTDLTLNSNNFTSLGSFPNWVEDLELRYNNVTRMDSVPTNCIYLNLNNNSVGNLRSIPSSILFLDLSYNSLGTLPPLPNNLVYLEISGTARNNSNIPTLPSSLTFLGIRSNFLTSLPPLPNKLTILNCGSNELTSLPNPLPDSLRRVYCDYNKLTRILNVPSRLLVLYCPNNLIDTIGRMPNGLRYLNCELNSIRQFPNIPTNLTALNCMSNALITLPTLSPVLDTLFCIGNRFNCLPPLPTSIRYLATYVPCIPNALPNLVQFSVPVCTSPCISTVSEEHVEVSEFNLFPNPSNTMVRFKYATEGNETLLTIVDMLGRTILSGALKQGSTEHEYSVSELPAGTYYVQLHQDGLRVNSKLLLIEH